MTVQHPACSIPFDQLIAGLEEEVSKGYITKKTKGDLSLWTYTPSCTYDGMWNLYTMVARGLITDNERIVALPFPKFFNLSENKTTIPDLPFNCYEKVDGSLIICYWYNGRWNCATKGSFDSDQAKWAEQFLHNHKFDNMFIREWTYLFEGVYPENKIVINYNGKEELVLLSGYENNTGKEYPQEYLKNWEGYRYIRPAMLYNFDQLNEVIERSQILSGNEEGYVLRFEDGTRVKIKGEEYCRLHKMISNITPLAIWENMLHHDDLTFIKKEIPEEFLDDFQQIEALLYDSIDRILGKLFTAHHRTKHLSDKEVGLMLDKFDPEIKSLIFPLRKKGTQILEPGDKTRETLYRLVRPKGNVLKDYRPSSAMNRVQETE